MAAEHIETVAPAAVAVTEKEPHADHPADTAAGPVRWEFQLSADRRRILVPIGGPPAAN